MKTIGKTVLAGYNAGIKRDRLRKEIDLIEFERTKEILLERLPKPPGGWLLNRVLVAKCALKES